VSTQTVELQDAHEHHDPNLQHHFHTKQQQLDASKLGMWMFLATEILLFGVLFVGFGLSQNKWPEEFKQAHHHLDRVLGAFNTVVLLVSSFTMVMAVYSASKNKQKQLVIYLVITILCALAFLGVKYFEYSHKFHEGLLPGQYFTYLPNTDPMAKGNSVFFAFYFMMTGLHGFHILGGVVVLCLVLKEAIKGRYNSTYFTPVDLVGLYWHLVDLIWIYLFPLLYLIQ
jgi:cytochrome c oxidase subunit III